MGQKIKCNECDHVFESQGPGSESSCPACGSNNLVFQKGSFFQERKRLLMIAGALLGLIIIIVLMTKCPAEKCDESTIEIRNVIVDVDPDCPPKRLASIKIDATHDPNCALRYTIDHGKTTNQSNPKFFNVENGRYDIYVAVAKEKGETNWIPWRGNPIIIRDTCPPPCSKLNILSCDTVSPTLHQKGKIIVHAETDCPPITFVLNDTLTSEDSIFQNIPGGAYIVTAIDSSGLQIVTFQDTVFMDPQPRVPPPVPCKYPPSKQELQSQINDLFNRSRGDQDLQKRILAKFSSRAVRVTGDIVETNQTYTIYQYLFRQNIGLPGTLTVEVKKITHNNDCKITSIEVEEKKNQ